MEAFVGAASSSLFAPTFPAHELPSHVALYTCPCRGSLRVAMSTPSGTERMTTPPRMGFPSSRGSLTATSRPSGPAYGSSSMRDLASQGLEGFITDEISHLTDLVSLKNSKRAADRMAPGGSRPRLPKRVLTDVMPDAPAPTRFTRSKRSISLEEAPPPRATSPSPRATSPPPSGINVTKYMLWCGVG